MQKYFLSPIWGQEEILIDLEPYLKNGDMVVLCGGYLHFSQGDSSFISFLSSFQEKYQNLSFFRSRFEEEMMIAAGMLPEKNYHFQHWINPFSGIFSCIKAYGLSIEAYLKSPEIFSKIFKEEIYKRKHDLFFMALKSEVGNANILARIEDCCRQPEEMAKTFLFKENGEVAIEWNLRPDQISSYVEKSLEELRRLSYVY